MGKLQRTMSTIHHIGMSASQSLLAIPINRDDHRVDTNLISVADTVTTPLDRSALSVPYPRARADLEEEYARAQGQEEDIQGST